MIKDVDLSFKFISIVVIVLNKRDKHLKKYFILHAIVHYGALYDDLL